MLQENHYTRHYRPGTGKLFQRIHLTTQTRTILPQEYYKKVGPPSDTKSIQSHRSGAIRRDALGQRVRDRFNEDVNEIIQTPYKQVKLASGLGKLEADRRSQASSQLRRRNLVPLSSKSVQKSLRSKATSRLSQASVMKKPVADQTEKLAEPSVMTDTLED